MTEQSICSYKYEPPKGCSVVVICDPRDGQILGIADPRKDIWIASDLRPLDIEGSIPKKEQ